MMNISTINITASILITIVITITHHASRIAITQPLPPHLSIGLLNPCGGGGLLGSCLLGMMTSMSSRDAAVRQGVGGGWGLGVVI